MLYKHVPLSLKAEGEGVISGYGAVYGNRDLGGDIIAPGAFAEDLKSGRKVRMLYQHDPGEVIGRWDRFQEDDHGLKMSGVFTPGVARASEVFANIKADALDGLSIGYMISDASDIEWRDGSRIILKAELWEVSVVTFPMNDLARIDGAKALADFRSGNPALLKRYVEGSLRDAGVSSTQAKAASGAAVDRLNSLREAGDGGLSELVAHMRATS